MTSRTRAALFLVPVSLLAVYGLAPNAFSLFGSEAPKIVNARSSVGPSDMTNSTNPDSSPLHLELPGARLVVMKSHRKLLVYDGSTLLRTYHIALGPNPMGAKERQGDGRTPEGEYYVCSKNPKSQYYLSLGLSYPNVQDAARGLRSGSIDKHQHDEIVRAIRSHETPDWYSALGGEIFIHGGGTGRDWTIGCIALHNHDIKELFDAAPRGLPVTIKP